MQGGGGGGGSTGSSGSSALSNKGVRGPLLFGSVSLGGGGDRRGEAGGGGGGGALGRQHSSHIVQVTMAHCHNAVAAILSNKAEHAKAAFLQRRRVLGLIPLMVDVNEHLALLYVWLARRIESAGGSCGFGSAGNLLGAIADDEVQEVVCAVMLWRRLYIVLAACALPAPII